MAQQALGDGLDHDQVVRREYRARVVDRLGPGRDPERAHPEILGESLGRLHRSRHALDRGPRPLEPFGRPLGLRDRLQRVQRAERGA